ncbi:MAG: uracil-DNA glycosylase family protein [Candidatus Saccharimonas sp.]
MKQAGDSLEFAAIRSKIIADLDNAEMRERGYEPVYVANPQSRILIISQAPGRRAQESHIPWDDGSGQQLRKWLAVSDEEFYDSNLFSIMPMDFYFPGKGAHGDLPPRKGFADKWHPQLLELMPDIEVAVLIGAYAQKYYLAKGAKSNLTETVRAYGEYLPKYLPLVHPSPLNFRWRTNNPWFELEVVPGVQSLIRSIISRD